MHNNSSEYNVSPSQSALFLWLFVSMSVLRIETMHVNELFPDNLENVFMHSFIKCIFVKTQNLSSASYAPIRQKVGVIFEGRNGYKSQWIVNGEK